MLTLVPVAGAGFPKLAASLPPLTWVESITTFAQHQTRAILKYRTRLTKLRYRPELKYIFWWVIWCPGWNILAPSWNALLQPQLASLALATERKLRLTKKKTTNLTRMAGKSGKKLWQVWKVFFAEAYVVSQLDRGSVKRMPWVGVAYLTPLHVFQPSPSLPERRHTWYQCSLHMSKHELVQPTTNLHKCYFIWQKRLKR